jgi:N-succinyldiaminopimelate aminotransferase
LFSLGVFADMKPTNAIFSGYGTSIFEVMSQLAKDHGTINLGQGFPDTEGPEDIRRVAAEAVIAGPNQYPPMMGLPELRQAVADHDRRFYGLEWEWQRDVLITSGGGEALADCIFGLIDPGDEVVLIEPLYEMYLPLVRRAGGVPKMVRIEPPDWQLPRDALEAACGPQTKLILINTPHNPSGKVFDAYELEFIADLAKRYDAYVMCDEVFEHIVFDGRAHVPLASLPGMRERCVRIGSAGKIFSMTGWKVGFVVGAAEIIAPIAKAHQFITFTTPPNLQRAVAYGLGKGDAYYAGLSGDLQDKRDLLARGLALAGFDVLSSSGTYFLTVDIRSVGFNGDDVDFCREITTKAGVTALPVSALYQGADVSHFARFAFCKRDEALIEATERLVRYFAM